MLTIRLEYGDSVPLEAGGIRPDLFLDKTLADLENILIWRGNCTVPLGEVGRIFGDPSKGIISLEGDWSRVRRLGEGMTSGILRVRGPAGMHLGAMMKGGFIQIDGDAGDWAGAEMRGGVLNIQGNAGNQLGGGYIGSRTGMRGGTILVGKNAGNEVGSLMRRGVISVLGKGGDHAGAGMIAGSMAFWGGCGIRPGAEMRRGSILCGRKPDSLLPTFSQAISTQPEWIFLLANHLKGLGQDLSKSSLARGVNGSKSKWLLCNGDLLGLGKGEILWPEG